MASDPSGGRGGPTPTWGIPLFFSALLRHQREPSWRAAVTCVASGLAVALSSLDRAAYLTPVIPLVCGSAPGAGQAGLLAMAAITVLALAVVWVVPLALTVWAVAGTSPAGALARRGAAGSGASTRGPLSERRARGR